MKLPVLLLSTCLWGLCAGCTQQAAERTSPAAAPAQALRDRATLDELRALVRREYRQQDYAQARTDLLTLARRYPHARTYPPLTQLAGRLDSLNQAQQRREQARQRRRAGQIASSAWQIAEYQDEFHKPAGRFYLTNAAMQWGEAVSPTADSARLAVRLLVDSAAAIHLMLYDRVPLVAHSIPARPHRHRLHLHHHSAPAPTYSYTTDYTQMQPLWSATPARYTVKVRANDGTVYHLAASNLKARLSFSAADSRALHSCLLEGGEISFIIAPDAQPTTTYRFTLANADAYEASYRRLLQRQ